MNKIFQMDHYQIIENGKFFNGQVEDETISKIICLWGETTDGRVFEKFYKCAL